MDADVHNLSADRRFITAYNTALQLSTIVLRASGFRTNPNKAGHHRISIDVLPEILGKELQEFAGYLNACRIKRNICDYTSSGEISERRWGRLLRKLLILKHLSPSGSKPLTLICHNSFKTNF